MTHSFAAFALLLAVAPSAAAQEEPPGADDPYTRGEPEAVAAAGYRSLGPFTLGDGVTTTKVEEALGGVEVRWIETEHFRIGSTLETWKLEDREEKALLAKELRALRQLLPDAPKRVRKLDPWLRAHLYALRAERVYDSVAAVLGADGESLEPLLGAGDRFVLLLFAKESEFGRFAERFIGPEASRGSLRHYFPRSRVLLYAAHAETDAFARSDLTLHCAVAYNLAIYLLDGYRGYGFALPAWLPVGFGHRVARSVSPKQNYFTDSRLFTADDVAEWHWAPRVRARVANDYFPSARKLGAWDDQLGLKFADHMMAWSRVDHLAQAEPEGFARFLRAMKAPFPPREYPIPPERLLERQWEALQAGLGWTPEEWDEAWREWVLATYPRR